MNQDERLARLALYLGLKCNAGAFHRVMRHTGSALIALTSSVPRELRVNLAPLLSGGLFEDAAAREAEAEKKGLGLLIWGADDYPEMLGEIPEPPPVLWIKGDFSPDDRFAVGLVGSRKASGNGLRVARKLGREGAAAGLTIVSGLAKGVDAAAHRGALEAGGRTLAVLGCGLDWVYPKENAALYAQIVESGALISEHPPETQPLPIFFPRRNRVIAGLSLAVVVVEAGERSGALITARLALEMNREVMAVPGPAGAATAKGAHRLIKEGAALVESMAEIMAEIRPRLLEGLCPPENPPALEPLPDEDEFAPEQPASRPRTKTRNEDAKSAEKVKTAPSGPVPEEGSPEAAILAALASGPKDHDTLLRQAGLSAAEGAARLLTLELEGHIVLQVSGQFALA